MLGLDLWYPVRSSFLCRAIAVVPCIGAVRDGHALVGPLVANVVWRPKYLFATFATCRVVSRRVVLVSRHVVTFMTVSARRHVVPAAMSSRHGRYVATRHAATRQLCRDMSRHVATCRDTSRPLWFAYSKLKKLLTQVSLYSLTTSWVDIFGDPRVQIPPWSILLSLGCTLTMWSSFLYM